MAAEQNIQSLIPTSGAPVANGIPDETSSGAQGGGLDFGPYLRTLKRNFFLIALATTATTLPAAYLALSAPKTYEGSFRLLVEPITVQGRSVDPSAISRAQTPESSTIDYPTLLQVLQSPQLLDKIAKRIQANPRYRDVTTESLTRDLIRQRLLVQRITGSTSLDNTRVIQVSYQGSDPDRVQYILKEIKEGYLRYSLEDRRTRIGGGVQFIEDQLPDLQKRVNILESRLQDMRQRYQLTDPRSDGESVSTRLQEARSLRFQTQRELAEQDALFQRLQNQLGLTPDQALQASALSQNPRYQELAGEIKKLDAQIAARGARLTDENPAMQNLLSQRRNLTSLLNSETQRILGERAVNSSVNPQVLTFQDPLRLGLIKQLVDTSNSRQLLQVRNQEILQLEAALNQRFARFPAIVREYNDIQQQLEIATKTLNQFLTQRETLRIEAAQKDVPWEVVAEPDLVKGLNGRPIPTAGASIKQLMMGFSVGLFLGVLLAFLKDKLNNKFLCAEDIPSAVKLPSLGVIPRKVNGSPLVDPMARNPFSKAFSEFYTSLRFARVNPVRSVVIGSADRGDGKTTTALNLALTAASMGQRVLLVDADLRSPQLHTLLGLTNHKGLSDTLSDNPIPWEESVQRSTLDKNLSVLTAGQGGVGSTRLLAASEMQTLMQRLHNAFDLVIYDTPGLVEFTDGTFLASQTDGMVLVVSVRKVKRPAVKHVLSELTRFRIPVLGFVSNHPGSGSSAFYPAALEEEPSGQPALLESLNLLNPAAPSQPIQPSSVDVIRQRNT